jgi:arylsulfatase A-like enzyme
MYASGPNYVSLPGYTEIFTGRRSHSCADNDCPPARAPTVFDELRSHADGPTDVAVFSSWDRIERAASADAANLVLSTGRWRVTNEAALRDDEPTSSLLDEGRAAPPFPGKATFRPDRYTAALALSYLESHRPRLMFLGLGEPDEYAHLGDYPRYLAALRAADGTLGQLFETLHRMGQRGQRTTVFVTADHGRARDYRFHGRRFPESARVWLLAAGGDVSARGLVRSQHAHRLADLAPTLRVLLGLPRDESPAAGAPIDELFASPLLPTAMAF